MKIIIFLISGFLLLSFKTDNEKKESISNSLFGKWVQEQDEDNTSFRYIKSVELVENTRGFIFHRSGKVTIYEEFGCQMPPNFRATEAKWEVKSNGAVIINDHMRIRRMKIIELDGEVIRFKWRKDKPHKRK